MAAQEHARLYGHEAFACVAERHMQTVGPTATMLARRWEQWLFGSDDPTEDRASFARCLPPKNYIVALMLDGREELRARLVAWIEQIKAEAEGAVKM